MKEKYYIGYIFEGEDFGAAVFCDNRQDCYLEELNPVNGVRRFQIVGNPETTTSEVRAAALSRIDSATSTSILAGFNYEVEGEALHFSYDSFDQQNFADTANGALLSLQGVESVPTSITWNGWRNHTKEKKGELVRLTLDVQTFLDLYTKGALTHKATQMELGGQRKAAVEACTTTEEINALLQEWGI